ncbi:MAG: hypothetical protein QXS20_09150 [Candidatus Thorarchaeota archaeon]
MNNTFVRFFAQRRGDVRKQRSSIQEALRGGPSTVTRLAEVTGMPKDLIVWNLIGMLRWGNVEIVGEQEDELLYALKAS